MSEQRMVESESYGGIMGELEKNRKRREKETKQKDFDKKIVELADKAIEFAQKRGQDDSMTVLLVNFLDVALEMKNIMETMSSINVAMECLSDAIGFLDAAIDFDNNLMDESLEHNYNIFSRWKARNKMRRTIRNNCGRMASIADGLAFKYRMATDMMKSLSGVSDKLKIAINRNALKKAKQASKKGEQAPAPASAAMAFIAERMKETGNTGTAPVAPTATVGGGSGNVSGGSIDDII